MIFPDGNFNGVRKCGAGFNYELKLLVSGLLGMRLEYKCEVNFYMHCKLDSGFGGFMPASFYQIAGEI